jgi:hypothetical protein
VVTTQVSHYRAGVLKVLTAEGQFRNPKFDWGPPKEKKLAGNAGSIPVVKKNIATWTSGSEVK